MSILIAGSRNPKNPFTARLTIDETVKRLPAGVVVLNGGADGVDTFVLDSIRKQPLHNIIDTGTAWTTPYRPLKDEITAIVFRPNWKRDGKAGGVIRNLHMLDLEPELVLVFWNGSSPGSKQVILEAQRRNLDVVVLEA